MCQGIKSKVMCRLMHLHSTRTILTKLRIIPIWNELGLTRLDRRRIRGDLIETYKILNGVYSIPRDTFFQFESLGLRGHDCKLFKKRFRLDVKKFCFSNRVADNWNCLSACCVSSNTVNTFKKHVSVELEPETVINQRQYSSTLSEIVGYIWLCLCLLTPLMS